MSQLLQTFAKSGSISVIDGVGAPAQVVTGIPIAASGAVAVDVLGVIGYYHQGLPFTAAGRLAVASVGAVTRFGGGAAPFTATSHLAMESAVAARTQSGIPYTAADKIAATL